MNSAKTVMRPDPGRHPAPPIAVRAAGTCRAERGWRWAGSESQAVVQLFWGVAGRGRLTVENGTFDFAGGDVAVKRPHERFCCTANSALWELRWVAFDGPGAGAFLESYAYPTLIRNAGPCPHHLFAEIDTGLQEMTPFCRRRLLAAVAELLALVGTPEDDAPGTGRVVRRFLDLARTKYADSTVNVNTLADMIGVHRTTLTRIVKERLRLSPKDYLHRLRMQHALGMLRDSRVPVAEIAARSGIPDATHFCRCVRQITGVGPREYRKTGRTAFRVPELFTAGGTPQDGLETILI